MAFSAGATMPEPSTMWYQYWQIIH